MSAAIHHLDTANTDGAHTGDGPTLVTSQPDVAIDVSNLTAGFGDNEVLHGLTVALPARSVTAIIGPSGCGKSTFLRCLNRLHETVDTAWSRGQVRLGDHDVYAPDVDPVRLRRHIGVVFQRPNPFPTMTIADNVLAGLRLTGALPRRGVSGLIHRALGRSSAKRINPTQVVEQALRSAALWDEVKDRLNKPAGSLSGGQQQRLCIARSLAVEPQVLLMDEPASALDPIATARIEELIAELSTRYAVVIVTHSMSQARRVSDQTAFLLSGDLIEFGATDQVFGAPVEQATADYVAGKFG